MEINRILKNNKEIENKSQINYDLIWGFITIDSLKTGNYKILGNFVFRSKLNVILKKPFEDKFIVEPANQQNADDADTADLTRILSAKISRICVICVLFPSPYDLISFCR